MSEHIARIAQLELASEEGARLGALLATPTITDLAVQDARRIREAWMLPRTGELNDQQIQFARGKLRAYMDQKQLETATVAKKIGCAPSTLSQWLSGSYTGDNSKLARKANSVVEQLARGEEPGLPDGFVTTTQTQIIMGLAIRAQQHRKIAIYTGPSGCSKTIVAEAIVAGACIGVTNAVHIRVTSAHRTPATLLRLIATEIDSRPASGPQSRILEGVIARLSGSDSLIIIDDAQRLDPRCDALILDLCKIARSPVLVLDTEEFDRRADDEGRWDGQFARHVIHRYHAVEEHERDGGTPLFSVDDVVKFAHQSMGLRLASDAAEWLTELACFPGSGALGRISMLLVTARLVMEREGTAKITLAHVQQAWESNRGLQHLTRHESSRRTVQTLRRRTA